MNNRIQNAALAGLLQSQQTTPSAPGKAAGAEFQAILRDRLKVSAHAQTRLSSRNIALEAEQWERVLSGVQRASDKGARESLVLVDDVALIVSVKNRTLITAVEQASLKDSVFTNIDSAVIV
jgi:flagellar operon protein